MKRKKPANDAEAKGTPPEKFHEAQGTQDAGSNRRSFLARLGVSATLLGLAGQAFAFLRSLVPNVLYEQPQRFKVGAPSQFGEGAKFFEGQRVFVFRERDTFFAISGVCTHLGCTVKMERLNKPKRVTAHGRDFDEQVEFHCPCHGSKYYGDGTNYFGPAPKPLAYYKLELAPDDGQLIVDMTTKVNQDFRLTV
jgi:menaquinol-cytochrome c reductase iron-sulfur subunit